MLKAFFEVEPVVLQRMLGFYGYAQPSWIGVKVWLKAEKSGWSVEVLETKHFHGVAEAWLQLTKCFDRLSKRKELANNNLVEHLELLFRK